MPLKIKTKIDQTTDIVNSKHTIDDQKDIEDLNKLIGKENSEENDVFKTTKTFLEEHLDDISHTSTKSDYEKQIQKAFEATEVKKNGLELSIDGTISWLAISTPELQGKYQAFKINLANHLVTTKIFEQKKEKLEQQHIEENEDLSEEEILSKSEEREKAIEDIKKDLKEEFHIDVKDVTNETGADKSSTTTSDEEKKWWEVDWGAKIKSRWDSVKNFTSVTLPDIIKSAKDSLVSLKDLFKTWMPGKKTAEVAKTAVETATDVAKEATK